MRKTFTVTGMSCAACAARVEKSVKALEGAENVNVNLLTGTMTLETERLSDEAVICAVKDAGYGAYVKGGEAKHASPSKADVRQEELKRKRTVLIWSVALLIPLMYVSMGHMIGLPMPRAVSHDGNPANFALLQLVLCIPVALINYGYYARGFRALFKKAPNMDSLIATGSAFSLIYGVFSLFLMNEAIVQEGVMAAMPYAHNLYFESSVMILALVDVGKYMEAVSKNRTGDALKRLSELAPQTAVVERNDQTAEIPASELTVGDVVQVKPGGRVPADGVIIEGGASMDESMLTGESIPVYRSVGENVSTATVATDSFFRMRVTKTGDDTSFSRIVSMVEEASASKPPISRLADKIAGIFVPVVMLISAAVLTVWLCLGASFADSLTKAISVLVVSCPCALGLATPVAVMVGTGRGAEKGILFRDGEALELAGRAKLLVADKTGTLTRGEPAVTGIYPFGVSETELLRYCAAAEKQSEHPLAKAIVLKAEISGIALPDAERFENVPGKGIKAEADGKRVLAGSRKLLTENGVQIPDIADLLTRLAKNGETPLLCALDEHFAGVISCADEVKNSSVSAVKQLKTMGIDTVMLTGDNEITAKAIAGRLGISNVVSGVLPDGKAKEVDRLKQSGEVVVMLGDGINDAPALKTADIGMAIGAGTDVAIESADVILMNSDPMDAANAVGLSRAVIRNIKQNLFWAFFYNVIMIPIAAGALSGIGINLSPMIASAAMSLSSIFVVTNALRLRRYSFIPTQAAADEVPNEVPDEAPKEMIVQKTKEGNCMTIKIEGMMCKHCQARVQKALDAISGVSAVVDLSSGTATVTAPETVTKEMLKKAVEDAGYEVTSIE